MKGMSLSELKAQNGGESETVKEVVEPQVEVDAETEEVSEVEETETLDQEVEDESSDDEELEAEVEEWMKGSDDRTIPLGEHIEVRQSLKTDLRNERKEKSELEKKVEELEARLQSQSKGVVSPPSQELKAPDVKEYMNEYDEVDWAKFNQDNNKYLHDMVQQQLQGNAQSQQEQVAQAQRQEQAKKVIDDHYNRAQKLVTDGVVKAKDYSEADLSIVNRFEQLMPGKGRSLADELVNHLSTVSDEPEKVWYKLGRDANLLNEVIQAYQADPSGVQGVAKLARISSQYSKPVARKSNAPKPTKQIKGNQSSSSDAAKLARKYKDAQKKGDFSASFKAKREAKKAGIDTSKW